MPRPRHSLPTVLARARGGATAVEFGLVALCVLTLLVMVIELSWQIATGAALDYGARQASRFAITGSCTPPGVTVTSPTNRSSLIRAVVSQSTGNFIVASTLNISFTAYNSFGSYQNAANGTAGAGLGGNTVAYTLSYAQPYLTGLAQLILGKASFTHVITIVVQNEPFITTARRRGVSAIEFALVAWVLALLALATVDLVTYIRIYFRLEQVAAQMGEVITQCQAINNPGDLNRFQAEAQIMAGDLNITVPLGIGSFIVTAIVPGTSTAPTPTVAWQYFSGNPLYGSAMCAPALTCKAGAQATVPGYTSVPPNQVLITTEATASVSPFIFSGKFISQAASVLHLDALFLVRSTNPTNLATITTNTAGTQGCGS